MSQRSRLVNAELKHGRFFPLIILESFQRKCTMQSRRDFLKATTALAVGSAALSPALMGCSSSDLSYEEAVRATWRHSPRALSGTRAVQRELVRYATLAASSHNTQCWQFRLEDRRITILPDLARRCSAVDPDDHHLFASLGCAAENLIQAARPHGLHAEIAFDAAGDVVRVALEPTRPARSPLFEAIPLRQCTRGAYDGKPLRKEHLRLLEQAGRGPDVEVLLLTDCGQMEQVLEYVVAGNTAQVNDPAFVAELKAWIRFNAEEAVRTGDGLFTRSSGNPTSPRWLGSLLFDGFFNAEKENEKYAAQVRSSAGLAVFFSEASDKAHWIEAGRCYERFALQGAALGIRNAMLNQPVEVEALRPQLASYLGLGTRRVDLVVRFGYGPEMPRSLRRPIDTVIV